MALRLDIYLKRTGQSLADWVRENAVGSDKELLEKCAYLGLSSTSEMTAQVKALLAATSQASKPAEEPSTSVSSGVRRRKAREPEVIAKMGPHDVSDVAHSEKKPN